MVGICLLSLMCSSFKEHFQACYKRGASLRCRGILHAILGTGLKQWLVRTLS